MYSYDRLLMMVNYKGDSRSVLNNIECIVETAFIICHHQLCEIKEIIHALGFPFTI